MLKETRKISFVFIGLNIFGIVCSLFYGIFGGSGGETTEGVYKGLFYTNIASVLFCVVIILFKFSWWRSNFIWAILVLVIYYPLTSVVLYNGFNNSKNRATSLNNFGLVPTQKYLSDKTKIEIFLKSEKKENYNIDTLLYSKSISKIVILGYIKDSSGVFKNFEIFCNEKYGVKSFSFPKGGNLIAEDTNKSKLISKVLNWYINIYSLSEDDSNSLWNYSDLWN